MWISDETMKEILPNVKLAEYQLLGVNWMALLNRTKFGKAKSGKKGNNVNGILADEMGLGSEYNRWIVSCFAWQIGFVLTRLIFSMLQRLCKQLHF